MFVGHMECKVMYHLVNGDEMAWVIESRFKDGSTTYSIETFRWEKDGTLHIKTYYDMPESVGKNDDPYQHIIKEKKLERSVTLQGWVERKELPSVFDMGKCFVISSYHEGFATTLLEAHARGLPSIVTRSSGFCGEFVDGYNAKTGIVFEPHDLEKNGFYKDISRLVKDCKSYEESCKIKAKIFSEENVLNPIFNACIRK